METSRVGENQFGAKVPTETSAIFNLESKPKKPVVRVARYGMPSLKNREAAGIAYREALRGGMSEEEAIEYSAMEAEVPSEFWELIPSWGDACKFKVKRNFYSDEIKRAAIEYFDTRKEEVGSKQAYTDMCKKFDLTLERSQIYHWRHQFDKKDKKASELKRDAEKARKMEEARNERSVQNAQDTASPKLPGQKCAHCGKEVPSIYGFVFCPFCGKPLESEKDYAIRMGESLKAVLIQKGFQQDMVAIVDTMLNVIKKEGK